MIEHIANSNKQIFIYAKDRNLKYLFCNEALAEVADLDSPKQIIGKTDHDFVWRPQASLYTDEDKDVFKGKIISNAVEPQTQRNRVITILTTKTLLIDKNGHPYGVAGHSVDITGYHLTKNNGYVDYKKNTFFLGETFGNTYFTKREFEIFKYLLLGKSVEEIALRVHRSIKTIQSQIKSISNKMQCTHKSEIVPTAIKYGLTYVLDEIN